MLSCAVAGRAAPANRAAGLHGSLRGPSLAPPGDPLHAAKLAADCRGCRPSRRARPARSGAAGGGGRAAARGDPRLRIVRAVGALLPASARASGALQLALRLPLDRVDPLAVSNPDSGRDCGTGGRTCRQPLRPGCVPRTRDGRGKTLPWSQSNLHPLGCHRHRVMICPQIHELLLPVGHFVIYWGHFQAILRGGPSRRDVRRQVLGERDMRRGPVCGTTDHREVTGNGGI